MATQTYTESPEHRNQIAWEALMALYLSARAEMDEYDNASFTPICDERRRIWPELMARCEREQAAMSRWAEQSGYDKVCDQFQELVDIVCERESALIGFPAPNLDALRWKLDKVLEPEGESTPCWDMSYVRQTIEDYRLLLGGAEA